MNDTKRGIAFYVDTVLLVLFLSVALAVLVQVFAAAQGMGTQAQRLSDGTLLAENAAELIAASESEEEFRSLVNVSPESEICLHYDVQNGIVKEAEDGFYCLKISLKKDGTLVEAQIDVSAEDELVYSLQTAANWRGE